MLVGLRTVQALVEMGEDPKHLYKHLEFMSKKATLGRFKSEAFTGYDCRVHERAGLYGLEVFSKMSAEDVATFFCAENMYVPKDKSMKKGNDGYRKKSSKACLNFNESGCSFKGCQYGHFCIVCEEQGHGRRDCHILKQRKPSQK